MGTGMSTLRQIIVAGLVVAGCRMVIEARADEAETPTFERHVRPILKTYCLDCHGGSAELKGKLDLRLARSARRGGKGGRAVVSGQPEESLLLIRMQAGEMPPLEKKVPPG